MTGGEILPLERIHNIGSNELLSKSGDYKMHVALSDLSFISLFLGVEKVERHGIGCDTTGGKLHLLVSSHL